MSDEQKPDTAATPPAGRSGARRGGAPAGGKSPRRRAREAALQGLYEWLVGGSDAGVIDAHMRELESWNGCDSAHFDALLHGSIREAADLDAVLARHVDRPTRDLSPVEHAILMLGAYELLHCLDIPYKVAINEGGRACQGLWRDRRAQVREWCARQGGWRPAPGGGRGDALRPGGAGPTPARQARMKLAGRLGHIEPFYVMECAKAASELARSPECDPRSGGSPMIFLNIGEPDFTAPAPVRRAATLAIERGHSQYTDAVGLPALRERISGWYAQRFGLSIDPSRIVVTAGASAALQLACLALIEAGDEVLMPDPSYPCNRHFVAAADGVPRLLPAGPAERFQLDAATVTAHWSASTRGVLLASPSNPTGTSIDPAEMARIVEVVRERGGFTIVDEIYLGLSYDDRYGHSALANGRRCDRGQQLLQVLQHDGLAARLAGAACRTGAGRGTAGAEPLHLPVHAGPACRAGLLRRRIDRRVRASQAGLSRAT